MYVCMYVCMCTSCEMCPVAFCEDCLPVDHEIIGPLSERWAPLGFKPLRCVT